MKNIPPLNHHSQSMIEWQGDLVGIRNSSILFQCRLKIGRNINYNNNNNNAIQHHRNQLVCWFIGSNESIHDWCVLNLFVLRELFAWISPLHKHKEQISSHCACAFVCFCGIILLRSVIFLYLDHWCKCLNGINMCRECQCAIGNVCWARVYLCVCVLCHWYACDSCRQCRVLY